MENECVQQKVNYESSHTCKRNRTAFFPRTFEPLWVVCTTSFHVVTPTPQTVAS